MFGAGVFTATGIITDALHVALAGLILAPHFHPLLVVSFSLINKTKVWKQGLKQTFLMYLALLAGAVLTGSVMKAFGNTIAGGTPAYLPKAGTLIKYWASLNPTAYYIAAVAGFVGSFVAASRQPSLIPSITIALALVPSMAIVGIAAVAGEWHFAGTAIQRWLIEVGLCLIFSALAFLLKMKLSNRG